MSTSLDKDLTILEALDFDITCDLDCDTKATWTMTARCCKSEWKLCDEHRTGELKKLKESPSRQCRPCGYRWVPATTINYDWNRL